MNMMKFFFSNAATHDNLADTAENAFAVHRAQDPRYKGGLQRLIASFTEYVYDPLRPASAAQVSAVANNARDYLTLVGNGMSEKAPQELLAIKKSDVIEIAHHRFDNSATVVYRHGFLGLGTDFADVKGIKPEELTAQVTAAGLSHKLRSPGM